jgi:nicotinate phosphoribosyltransferase
LIYKLVEVERGGQLLEAAKFSKAKVTYPGRKQVLRFARTSGEWKGDRITLESESFAGGVPLLVEVMRGGKRTGPPASVRDARQRCLAGLARLPERYRQVSRQAVYPVSHSERLEALLDDVRRRINGSPSRRKR